MDRRVRKLQQAVTDINAKLAGVPDNEKLRVLKRELRNLPKDVRDPVANLVLTGVEVGRHSIERPSTLKRVTKWIGGLLLAACGIVITQLLTGFGDRIFEHYGDFVLAPPTPSKPEQSDAHGRHLGVPTDTPVPQSSTPTADTRQTP